MAAITVGFQSPVSNPPLIVGRYKWAMAKITFDAVVATTNAFTAADIATFLENVKQQFGMTHIYAILWDKGLVNQAGEPEFFTMKWIESNQTFLIIPIDLAADPGVISLTFSTGALAAVLPCTIIGT